ncbi:hypothetical protein WBG78_08865 [Chryseolinea sp. T2]|uniref:hypothetical protein n=1 Tax=Chryseolinea sp. T2 TaxID=3129255 RepID=UPI003078A464
MEESFESSRESEGTRRVVRRRQGIVTEQEREVNFRERGAMKVVFRRSEEEARLIALLSTKLKDSD